ncbi:MAG: hypothetical protein ACM3ZE_05525 [Myxococcales bacterium]
MTDLNGTEGGIRSPIQLAYEQVRDEMHALGKKVDNLNIDVVHVVTRALGVSSAVQYLRDEAAQLAFFDVTTFDRLPVYARALLYVYISTNRRRPRLANVREMAARLSRTRDCLLADLEAVRKRVALQPPRCDFGGNRSYTELVQDVMVLVTYLSNNWSLVEGRIGVRSSELVEAYELADQFVEVLGTRKAPLYDAAKEALERAQAFTLVQRTYEQLRRGVSFLRWEDRDRLVPSLYSGRFKRRRGKKASPENLTVGSLVEAPLADATLLEGPREYTPLLDAPPIDGPDADESLAD